MNLTLTHPRSKAMYWALPILLSIVVCLASHIRLFLPFTPVPITLQVHLILLFSYILADKRAVLMSALFLLQGLCGFSVFASGGGLACLFGPTGGFLVGYLVSSLIVVRLSDRSALVAMGIGNIVVYLFGWIHLSQFLGVTNAALLGIAPFVLPDLCKLWLANSTITKRASLTDV